MELTMKEKQAVTKQLALTYKRAGKKEKGKILDTVIELECKGCTPPFILGCSLRNQVKISYQSSVLSCQERKF